LLITAVLLAFGGLLFAAKTEIKFASVAPEGSTWMNIMQELADTIEEKTGGEVKFKFYAGGVSGDEKDVIKKMRINQLHAAGFTSQGLGEIVPEVRVLNIPLMLDSNAEVDYVMEKMTPYFNGLFEKKGFIVLGWPEVGFAYIYTTKKVDSPASMKKVKMWVWGDDVLGNSLFKNVGVAPIALSLTDVMQSLQTGLIEGVYGSPLSALSMQWNTKVKYMLDLKIALVPGGVLVNKSVWNKISPASQKIIISESAKALRRLTEVSRKENDEAVKAMIRQGITVVKVASEEDMKLFSEASEKTAAELTGKFYKKELLDELKKHISEYRAKNTKK
ncbi:MAG TPA: TRAP transporter substrate-binding protein DctP, partial [Candidatus Goldiibacteriota bacterium]|nr:TRAP transporter substrate-binding protein DctP [Candidatus Goldiibacteriota bacterium]